VCGVGPRRQVTDIKKITCLFWLKIRELFGAKKSNIEKTRNPIMLFLMPKRAI